MVLEQKQECACQHEFTQRSSGRKSFHQLNTFTLTRSLSGISLRITFTITLSKHKHARTHTHTGTHKNKRRKRALMPCHATSACNNRRKYELSKGQRTQRDSCQCRRMWRKRRVEFSTTEDEERRDAHLLALSFHYERQQFHSCFRGNGTRLQW